MNKTDAQLIRTIIQEEVPPIINSIVDNKFAEVNDKLDSLTLEVHDMHQDIDGLKDQSKLYYENNKRDINEIRAKLNMPKSPSLTEAADYPH